jgi:hypothetical protein
VVLLRKSLPQNYNLKTAAELGVMGFFNFFYPIAEGMKKQKQEQKQRNFYFVRFWVIVSRHIERCRRMAKS